MGEGAEIHSHTYIFRTTIKGTKKKNSKNESTTAEQCVRSKAPLTLIKRKRVVKKPIVTAVVSEESYVNREPLVKRMRKTQPFAEVKRVGESTAKITIVRVVEGEAKANMHREPE